VQQQVDDTATTRQGCQVLWVNINALQQTIRKYVAANSH
jgi:sulfite reductase beta subunit-like hemoprotein